MKGIMLKVGAILTVVLAIVTFGIAVNGYTGQHSNERQEQFVFSLPNFEEGTQFRIVIVNPHNANTYVQISSYDESGNLLNLFYETVTSWGRNEINSYVLPVGTKTIIVKSSLFVDAYLESISSDGIVRQLGNVHQSGSEIDRFNNDNVSEGNIKSGLISNFIRFGYPLTSLRITQGYNELSGRRYHTGIDYGGLANTPIYSIGLGTIESFSENTLDNTYGTSAWGNNISVRHLLNTGMVWWSQYAHLAHNSVPDYFRSGDGLTGTRVVKGTLIGGMGNTGNSTGVHLHFQIRNQNAAGNGYYENPAETYGFVSPVNFVNGDYGYPLIPYLSTTNTPSIDNYTVYGISNQPLYASLTVRPSQQTTFQNIGVGGRDEQQNDARIFIQPNATLDANSNPLTGSRVFVCNDPTATGCDHRFYAYIGRRLDGQTWVNVGAGYPLKVTILPNAQSEIIDNDMRNVDLSGDPNQYSSGRYAANESGAQDTAGYYISAKLFQGGGSNWARWFPTRGGNYKIFVHIPNGATATNVQYKIYLRGRNPNGSCSSGDQLYPCYTSDPVNHSTNNNRWVHLTLNNDTNTTFSVEVGGYVGLAVGALNNQQYAGVDAVKFISVGGLAVTLFRHPVVRMGLGVRRAV